VYKRQIIDSSFKERRDILALLERVRQEGISLHEMEEIGRKFQKAGRRALRPLVRELWRESSGDLISKYAYILDFFDTQSWLDQLIQIALKRRDLGEDGKAALLIILEGYGVDVNAPVFRNVFGSPGSTLHRVTQGALQLGEEGIVTFLDEFLACSNEVQLGVLRELGEGGDPKAVRMLEALLWHQDQSVVRGALQALGRIRDPQAAGTLAQFLREGDPELCGEARHYLRRLAFLGVTIPPPAEQLPFQAGYATLPDGDGYRSLMIGRWMGEGRLAALYLQVHERRGLLAAWGSGSLSLEQFEREVEGFCAQDDLQPVLPEYVIALLRDALYWSGDLCYLPADYYLRRTMFAGVDLSPQRFHPSFEAAPLLTYREGEEISRQFFEDPLFTGWYLGGEQVLEIAEEFQRGADREAALTRICSELITPELEPLRERLLNCADLMRRCGRGGSFVTRLVALAASLKQYKLPHHLHPFLRAFAWESLEIALETLAEGGRELPLVAEEG
jgi:hypothetical protein